MARAVGPTIPRWQLGEQLTALRAAAGITREQAAEALGASPHTVRKIEQGNTGVRKNDLAALLDLYQAPDDARAQLQNLQKLGAQRGWWSRWSRHISTSHATFLGIESAARVIHSWQPIIVPGLLQTDAYAHALAVAQRVPAEQIEPVVAIKRKRQEQTWGDEAPATWFLVDESVLYRKVGSDEVMREQLERLLDLPDECTLHVVPMSEGAHPGTRGALNVYEFDPGLHTPVAWTDGWAGQIYLEEDEVDECRHALNALLGVAWSPSKTAAAIRSAVKALPGRPHS